MARGVTETHVHTAADELIPSDERLTDDRIRVHLGTGSPSQDFIAPARISKIAQRKARDVPARTADAEAAWNFHPDPVQQPRLQNAPLLKAEGRRLNRAVGRAWDLG